VEVLEGLVGSELKRGVGLAGGCSATAEGDCAPARKRLGRGYLCARRLYVCEERGKEQPDSVVNTRNRELTGAAPMADGGAQTAVCVREERSGTCLYSRGRSVASL
jgi:hypothetical protein